MTTEIDETVLLECSESILTCQICMERFESPRILPCQHTFCKACVTSLVRKHCFDGNGHFTTAQFPCPNCRKSCKIRAKTIEEAEKLKAFPEHLLLKTLLEASEVKPKRNEKITHGIVLSENRADQIQDILRRYRQMIVYMRKFLQQWPTKEPRLSYPIPFCTDIRAKISHFMQDLIHAPKASHVPKLRRDGRALSNLVSRVMEEEQTISSTFTLEKMRQAAREVAETPCCLEYIPLYTTMREIHKSMPVRDMTRQEPPQQHEPWEPAASETHETLINEQEKKPSLLTIILVLISCGIGVLVVIAFLGYTVYYLFTWFPVLANALVVLASV